ncbi:putative protein PTGES3L [Osmerus eperlanus]|uniref:putative protein PTGES3L n=1 Tax=Osmerus eperlanus TaxID=29151 RepID=UPI002E15503F
MSKIVRPDDCQPANALWYDRKKYVTINFMVQKPRDVQVEFLNNKMVLCCKSEDETIYNEIYFYDEVLRFDSREKVYDRSINVLLRKITPDVAWPRLQKDTAKPSWINVDFDNWRDWEHEEDEGMAEFEQYADMMQEMTSNNKSGPPAMDDLFDLDDD